MRYEQSARLMHALHFGVPATSDAAACMMTLAIWSEAPDSLPRSMSSRWL